MSYIFDALQRAEAERPRTGSDPGPSRASTAVFELLERAERAHFAASDRGQSVAPSALEEPEPLAAPSRPPLEAARANAALAPRGPARVSAAIPPLMESCEQLTVDGQPQGRLVSTGAGGTPAAEAFRLLSVRLRQLRRERPLKRLLVTSTIPQEGKSVVSANLACAMASGAHQRVVLVEGDVRRPSLAKIFGLAAHPGLCEWLEGKRSLPASVYRLQGAGIWMLPAGFAPGNPLELLESARLPQLLDQLSEMFDWVIIDSPPILPIADTSVWSRLADGILLVTRQGVTEKRHLQRGLEAIDSAKFIGALLNSSRNTSDAGYYSYTPLEPS
jgi:capsular exopolysaccharide synthesis family protein